MGAGRTGDPSSMRFPHLYGPLPVAAVTSVLPYRPGPDGRFAPPVGLPAVDDAFARAYAFERSLAERRAAAVLPVSPVAWRASTRGCRRRGSTTRCGSRATTTPRASRPRPTGCSPAVAHRRVVMDRPPPADARLGGRGAAHPGARPGRARSAGARRALVAVTQETMAGLWAPSWRRDLPGIDDAAVDDLVRRESFANAHVADRRPRGARATTACPSPGPSCASTARRPRSRR